MGNYDENLIFHEILIKIGIKTSNKIASNEKFINPCHQNINHHPYTICAKFHSCMTNTGCPKSHATQRIFNNFVKFGDIYMIIGS